MAIKTFAASGPLSSSLNEERDLGSPNCSACLIGQYSAYGLTLWSSPHTVQSVRLRLDSYSAGQLILRDGKSCDLFGTLRSGWAFRFKEIAGGRRQILGFMIPGDAITLEALWIGARPLPFCVGALSAVTVCWFDINQMSQLTQDRSAQKEHLQEIARSHILADAERMAALGQRNAHGRVVQLLLHLVSRLKERNMNAGQDYAFPLTQNHLADALGLTTIHINRVLRDLRKRGILAIDGGTISVFDEKAMRDVLDNE